MTPNGVKNAFKAIQELSGVVLPYKVSRNLSKLKKRLGEELDTVAGMEQALIKRYGGKIEKNGAIKISGADAQAFADEFNALMAQNDDSIKLPTVDLSKYTDMIRISPGAVEALEGIVIFEEDTDA